MSYQLLEPGRVFFNLTGLEIAAGGTVTFYEVGTTTPKNTYSDPGLVTLNANPVDLDSSGRMETEAWGTGNYDVLLKDADGATVWTREVNSQVQAGATIPALEADEFLTSDGTTLSWQPVSQVPDTTGSEGAILTVAGGLATWVAPAVAEDFDIVVDGNSATIDGTGGKLRWLVGSATGVNAGGRTQTVSVTFPSAFSSTPVIASVQLNNASALATGTNQPSARISSTSTTGFTVVWVMGEIDDSQSQYDFSAAVSFAYLAIGPVA